MLGYMPSEIARLVLGYLETSGCEKAKAVYMRENLNIREYARQLNEGRVYPLTIEGKDLETILHHYYVLTHTADVQRPVQDAPTKKEEPRRRSTTKKPVLKKVLPKSKPKFKKKKTKTTSKLKRKLPSFLVTNAGPSNRNLCKEVDASEPPKCRKRIRKANETLKKKFCRNIVKKSKKLLGKGTVEPSESSSHSDECNALQVSRQTSVEDRATSPLSPACGTLDDEPSHDPCSSSVLRKAQNDATVSRRQENVAVDDGTILRTVRTDSLIFKKEKDDFVDLCSSEEDSQSPRKNFLVIRSQEVPQNELPESTNDHVLSGTDDAWRFISDKEHLKPGSCMGNQTPSKQNQFRKPGSFVDSLLLRSPLHISSINSSARAVPNSPSNIAAVSSVRREILQRCPEESSPCLALSQSSTEDSPVAANRTPSRQSHFRKPPSLVMKRLIHGSPPRVSSAASSSPAAPDSPSNFTPVNSVEPEIHQRCPEDSSPSLLLSESSAEDGPVSANRTPSKQNNFRKPRSLLNGLLHSSPLHSSSVASSPCTLVASPSDITPVNSVEPELPQRYPEETSPRFALSQKRAETALVAMTPVKQYHQEVCFFSPKRKSHIPRRRRLSSTWIFSPSKGVHTVESAGAVSDTTANDKPMDFSFLLEEVLNYSPFISKLAENINKAQGTDNTDGPPLDSLQPTLSLTSGEPSDAAIAQSIINDIITETENDPFFEDILNKFIEKHETSREMLNTATSSDMSMLLNDTILTEGDLESGQSCSQGIGTDDASKPASLSDSAAAANSLSTTDINRGGAQSTGCLPLPPQVPAETSTSMPVLVVTNKNVPVESRPVTNVQNTVPVLSIPESASTVPDVTPQSSTQSFPTQTFVCLQTVPSSGHNVVVLPNHSDVVRTILPSPKKDILQRTLESLDITSSPVKPNVVPVAAPSAPMNITTSEYGTCIQVINQPIMSSKPSNTIVVNGTTITPGKVPYSALNIITLSPGKLYSQCMREVLQNDVIPNQVFRPDLPVIMTTQRAPPINRRSVSRLAASRKTLKDRIKEAAHVRTLDFGQPGRVVLDSMEVETEPSSLLRNACVSRQERLVYVNASGQEEQVSTIDMSQLDLVQSTSGRVDSPSGSQALSSDTESAAATLMSLRSNNARVVRKESLRSRPKEKKPSTRKRKASPPTNDLLKKMNIDKFLSTVHK